MKVDKKLERYKNRLEKDIQMNMIKSQYEYLSIELDFILSIIKNFNNKYKKLCNIDTKKIIKYNTLDLIHKFRIGDKFIENYKIEDSNPVNFLERDKLESYYKMTVSIPIIYRDLKFNFITRLKEIKNIIIKLDELKINNKDINEIKMKYTKITDYISEHKFK